MSSFSAANRSARRKAVALHSFGLLALVVAVPGTLALVGLSAG